MIYFSSVKSHGHIVMRKATALFFIGLMLFINAIKLFHTHPDLTRYTSLNKTKISHHSGDINSHGITQNDHCAICDFRLTKDAEATETFIASIPLLINEAVTADILPTYITAFHSTSPGRAPPVLV